VDMIGFDEFIIDKGSLHYLQNELKQFQDFYNTVDRFQDRVKVMFMANAVALTNPYFIGWRLKPRKVLKLKRPERCVLTQRWEQSRNNARLFPC
ncbi:MAG: phage DNA encapsidation protein, partial [Firmicutes bacterium]|nr:phage DNA encapsidation protein [Bacillota bacterium]